MDESTVSLSNDSRLVDDIETVFKDISILSARIRNILTTGIGGNPIPLYVEFKGQFDFLFCMSSDHKNIREMELKGEIVAWRDKAGISYPQIIQGLKLFEQYKTELFKGQLLRFM
jgi:hypothetical protein